MLLLGTHPRREARCSREAAVAGRARGGAGKGGAEGGKGKDLGAESVVRGGDGRRLTDAPPPPPLPVSVVVAGWQKNGATKPGTPGTGRKNKRTSFGAQSLSQFSSSPSWGIGSADRNGYAKQYISAEHAKVMGGMTSPGAVYKLISSIDKQPLSKNYNAASFSFGSEERLGGKRYHSVVPGPGSYKRDSSFMAQNLSTKQTAPSAGFGTSNRDNLEKVFITEEHNKINFGIHSPGPSAYNAGSSVGKQTRSDNTSAPSWQIGKDSRFQYDFVKRAQKVPGAGQYSIKSTVGKQVDSTKPSMPQHSFGSGTRAATNKLFISVEHEKSQHGLNSPGPATALPSSSMGRQMNSNSKSQNPFSFGTSKRIVYADSGVPGPGHYD